MPRKILPAILVAVMLSMSAVNVAHADSPARGCVKGAITGSVFVWVVAVVAAPFTAGASLAVAPAADVLIAGAAAGCILGATQEAAANTILGD